MNEIGYYCKRDKTSIAWPKGKLYCLRKRKCKSLRIFKKGILTKPKALLCS